jgi:hypothetical protein
VNQHAISGADLDPFEVDMGVEAHGRVFDFDRAGHLESLFVRANH